MWLYILSKLHVMKIHFINCMESGNQYTIPIRTYREHLNASPIYFGMSAGGRMPFRKE
jgi:hypothetical protein